MGQSQNSTLEFKRIGASLGAEVSGLDLTQPLDDATVGALAQAQADRCEGTGARVARFAVAP